MKKIMSPNRGSDDEEEFFNFDNEDGVANDENSQRYVFALLALYLRIGIILI